MNSQRKERVSMDLNQEVIELLDALKVEYGVKSRGDVVNMLITDLLRPDGKEDV